MSASWWESRFLCFDVESTDVALETARIVSAAVVLIVGGRVEATWTWLVNPGVPIEPGAIEAHGITDERVQAEGQDAREAVGEILAALRVARDVPIVVYNGVFDATIADREARRYGYAPLEGFLMVDGHVIDKHLDPFRRGSRKLEAVCEYRKVVLAGAHDAAYDALAAGRLAYRLCRDGRIVRDRMGDGERRALDEEWDRARGDAALLHAAQVAWRAEQAAGLEAYFRKGNPGKGVPPRPDAVVERAWPVIPVPEQTTMETTT